MFIHDKIENPVYESRVDHKRQHRSFTDGFVKVMFGTMINTLPPSDTYESESTTAQREYSTNPQYGKYNTNTNNTLSCQQKLNNMEASGEIQPGETCTCPSGATTPQCVTNNNFCSELLTYDQQDSKLKYDYCTCSGGASTPTCTPYYQLCEENLPTYEQDYPDDECSCSDPATSATPDCVSYYQLCEDQLGTVQSENPDDVCYCNDPSTSPNPICESDYNVCEQNAEQYENNNTTCTCSDTSTEPTCCTSTTTQSCSTTQQCTTLPTACASEKIYLVAGTDPNGDTISLPVSNPSYLYYWFTNGQWEYWNGTYFSGTYVPASGPYQFTFSGCSGPYYGNTGIPGYENCVLTGSGGSCSQKSCNPVTTCTPVTTQSCTTEP